MSAQLAPSAAPINALRMWTNGVSIFVELPTKLPLAPVIIAYQLSTGGLSKALALLNTHADYSGRPQSSQHRTTIPRIGTPMQSSMAESILRRKGMIR